MSHIGNKIHVLVSYNNFISILLYNEMFHKTVYCIFDRFDITFNLLIIGNLQKFI